MSLPESEPIRLTQAPLPTPENYVDGNPDYWAARAYALSQGYPRRSIGVVEADKLVLLRDEPMFPWIDREDKHQQPMLEVSYCIKTLERGFMIIRDPVAK